jgi:hypothetical protein
MTAPATTPTAKKSIAFISASKIDVDHPRDRCASCGIAADRAKPISRGCAEHAICGTEVPTHEGDELPVGRVIDRLDADDLRLEGMIPLVHVLDEFELRFPRSNHENLACARERLCDIVIKVLLVGGMISLGGLHRMPAEVLSGVNHLSIDCLVVNVENLGLVLIDPNSRV